MSKNILQALGKIDVALGGQTNDAANVIQALNQISERAGNLKNSMEEINSVDIKILSTNEYDSETGLPIIQNPDESTFYLVPSGDEEGNNLFNEYYYNGESWELFGSGGLKLDDLVVVAGTGTGSAMVAGNENLASGQSSFAEGFKATASGPYSHAEGSNTTASGQASHAEGASTMASGNMSHAEGASTIASHRSQHVFGECNISDSSTAAITARGNYIEIVGNGASPLARSNARTLDWSGNEVLAGKLTVGTGPTENMDVATKQYVDEHSSSGGGLQNLVDGSVSGSVRGINSKAEDSNYTIGSNAVAEGVDTTASGNYSHAEGGMTIASGNGSHAEGFATTASSAQSHAEGMSTTASGNYSHAEGSGTKASGGYSHAEGYSTTASGSQSHAEGVSTLASGDCSHAEGGWTTASGYYSHAEGSYTIASGEGSHAEGSYTIASGEGSHAGGQHAIASGNGAYTEGNYVDLSTAQQRTDYQMKLTGNANTLTYTYDELPLYSNIDINNQYFINNILVAVTALDTENNTITLDKTLNTSNWTNQTVIVIKATVASGQNSHAEGQSTTASEQGSHAEGIKTIASGNCSHAEGYSTTASGDNSHAEGSNTKAFGDFAHAEGVITTASGQGSHAEGMDTIANHKSQHVFGEYNIEDSSTATANNRGNYIEIVGNGTYSTRSNARTLDWNGNESLQGSLTLGKGTANETTITAAQLKFLLALLNT